MKLFLMLSLGLTTLIPIGWLASPSPEIPVEGPRYVAFTNDNCIVLVESRADRVNVQTIYILQGGQGLQQSFSSGTLTFRENYLVLQSRDQPRSVVLTLTDFKDYQQNAAAGSNPQVYKGFGLVRIFAKQNVNLDNLVRDVQNGNTVLVRSGLGDPSTPDTRPVCIAGGCGANACSLNADAGVGVGCSIGCNPGFYACCGLTGCSCYKDDCK